MRMWQGAVGVSNFRGIVSPAYIVLKPRIEINPKYYHYLLRTPYYVGESYRFSYGICDDQLSLRYEDFKRMKNIMPPKYEQDQIVKYLDYKLAKINKFIKAKKRLINVLKEQKQAVINEAVTKGLNPNVKMKPSGIDWLGNIPEHWEIRRIKTILKDSTFTVTDKLPNEIYLGLENVESWTGKIVDVQEDVSFDSQTKKFNVDNILFGKLRPYLAKVVIPNQPGVCSTEFLVLKRIDDSFLLKYLEFHLRSKSVIDIITSSTYGAKMPRADWGFIGNLKVALPSTIEEQQEIIDFITEQTKVIDKRISIAEKEIDLIIEYRTRLISDVVTGKIDVRGIEVDDVFEEDMELDNVEEELEEHEEAFDVEECEV